MKEIIKILNKMIKDKIIDDFVLGGATALLYYADNIFQTEDIDIFISVKHLGLIFNLEPIYTYLKYNYDAKEYGEYIIVKDFPLQFLLPGDSLHKEAIKNFKTITIQGEKCKIFSFEYLIALMIFLFKPKYRERIRLIIEGKTYDEKKLNDILKRHSLLDKFNKIKDKFNEENILWS